MVAFHRRANPQSQWAHQGSLRHLMVERWDKPCLRIGRYEYTNMERRNCTFISIIHVFLRNDGWAPQGLTTKHLRGHTSFVFCVNYNTASTLLVSGGCEGDVRIWNIARGALTCDFPFGSRMLMVPGKCIKTLNAHLDYVTAVHFNRDASLIVSCSLDGLMYVPSGFIYLLQ